MSVCMCVCLYVFYVCVYVCISRVYTRIDERIIATATYPDIHTLQQVVEMGESLSNLDLLDFQG